MKSKWTKYSPVCFMGDNKVVLYNQGILYVYNAVTFSLLSKKKIIHTFKECVLSRFKILNRLLRCGVRVSLPISDTKLIFFVNKKILEYDIESQELSEGYNPERGVRPLYFTEIKDVEGFDNMIVWGGYLSNPTKREVSIYKRCDVDSWEVIYTFENGSINHIHNLIPDKENKCVWILTGDFEAAACIWKATNNFTVVEPILKNSQKYRGCVAFPYKSGLLYATDSQFTQNSIRFLYKDGLNWKSKRIKNINGTCIYGCKSQDKYVFATSVEGMGIYKNIFQLFTDRKRGPGIIDDNICLYRGSLDDGFEMLYSQRKDIYPFIFQFGAFQFPSGENNHNYILLKHFATKNKDMSTVKISYK